METKIETYEVRRIQPDLDVWDVSAKAGPYRIGVVLETDGAEIIVDELFSPGQRSERPRSRAAILAGKPLADLIADLEAGRVSATVIADVLDRGRNLLPEGC